MANARRQQPISVESNNNYINALDYDANNNLVYLGRADIGSATSSAVWQIRKVSYDANFNLINIKFAGGNEVFNNIWDNRAAYAYS